MYCSQIVHVAAVPAHCEKMASRPSLHKRGLIHISRPFGLKELKKSPHLLLN